MKCRKLTCSNNNIEMEMVRRQVQRCNDSLIEIYKCPECHYIAWSRSVKTGKLTSDYVWGTEETSDERMVEDRVLDMISANMGPYNDGTPIDVDDIREQAILELEEERGRKLELE